MFDELLLAGIAAGIVYLVMVLIAGRRERELAQTRVHEARLRSLTELSADWFWETDAESRVSWLSGGGPVAMLFGDTPVYGCRFWEIAGVEVDARSLESLRERLGQALPFFDLEIARRDARGARQVHIVSGQARRDAQGRLVGYRGVGRDVTEQRRAERGLARAKERLELALDGGNLAEWHVDGTTGEIFAGDGWVRFLGHDRSPSLRMADMGRVLHPDDIPHSRAALIRVLKDEAREFDVEVRARVSRGAGGWKWLNLRGRVVERNAEGRAVRVSGVVADIDARKRAELALREAEARFRDDTESRRFDVAAVSSEYVWEADAEWRFTYLSERAEAVLGYPRAELLGRALWEIVPLGEERAVREWLAAHGGEGAPFRDLVHRVITRSGSVVWLSLGGLPLHADDGRWIGYRGTAADVSLRKQAETRIEQLAKRDGLTGLANRQSLEERTGQAILSAARERAQIALLVIDLDRFKLVNESLGHGAGDVLVRAVAERLQGVLRRDDTLGRTGGDEFVVLWNGLKSREEAAALGERLLASLGRPFSVEGRSLTVGASIGVALYPRDGRDFSELLQHADAAMYHAKESGRGAFRFYHPAMGARAAERLRLENELRGALARSELLLHWQPVVRGKDRVVGAEALVRWQHPARGLIGPEEFVPLAEECGLIRAVGEWTLERALSQVGAWQRELPAAMREKHCFAVNVSAPELAEGDAFADKVRDMLKAHGVDGTCLELEVTERVLMGNFRANAETLRRVGELGVQFAIDDFGTGYSSLAYLRQLPIDKLKIDRMFLGSLETNTVDQAIVRTIVSLAKTLGIAVAAEGVEYPGQLERLLELGCDQWQGMLFNPGLDAQAFASLYTSSRTARRSEG